MKISCRRLLTGLVASLLLASAGTAHSANLLPYVWEGILGGDHRAVYFTDGIKNDTYPSAAVNDINNISAGFDGSAVLDLPYYTGAWYWSAWLNTVNQPFANVNGAFPLFGLQSTSAQGRGVGEIVTIRILPPGIYPVFPYIGGGSFNTIHPTNPVVQIFVQNPQMNAITNATQFYAPIDNIALGVWRWLAVSFNPFNQPAGSGPAIAQVAMGGPGRSPPTVYTAYQSPVTGAQRTRPNFFAVPVGDAFGLGNPQAWVGMQPPFSGINPGKTWAQNNAYVGGMQQLIFDAGSFKANPSAGGVDFPGVNLYDMANDNTLMTSSGLSIPISNQTLTLPNSQGPHTPTVLLQGGARPPTFLYHGGRQDYLIIDGQPLSNDFYTPTSFGNVSIQSIDFGERIENRTIGGPGGGDP